MEGTIGPIDNCTIQANDVDSGNNGNVSYHIANSKVRCFGSFKILYSILCSIGSWEPMVLWVNHRL